MSDHVEHVQERSAIIQAPGFVERRLRRGQRREWPRRNNAVEVAVEVERRRLCGRRRNYGRRRWRAD